MKHNIEYRIVKCSINKCVVGFDTRDLYLIIYQQTLLIINDRFSYLWWDQLSHKIHINIIKESESYPYTASRVTVTNDSDNNAGVGLGMIILGD